MAAWQPTGEPGHAVITLPGKSNEIALASQARVAAVGIESPASVVIFNPDTGNLLATVALSGKPISLAVDATGTKLYALLDGKDTITVVDIATKKVATTFTVGGDPKALAINPARSEILIVDSGRKRLIGYDPAASTILRQQTLTIAPSKLAIGRTGTRVVVASTSGDVQVLDGTSLAVLKSLKLGDSIRSIGFWDQGNLAVAVQKNQDAVSLIDIDAGVAVSQLPIDGDPERVSLDGVSNRAYVTTDDDAAVNRVDMTARRIDGRYLLPSAASALVFDPTGAAVLLALPKEAAVLKIDPLLAPLLQQLQLHKRLKDIAVNNITHEAAAIADKVNEINRIRLQNKTVDTLALPGAPVVVAFDTGRNLAVYADGQKVRFVNLSNATATLLPNLVDLGRTIVAMAVDSTRGITVVLTKGSGDTDIHLIDNVSFTKTISLTAAGNLNKIVVHPGLGRAYVTTDNKKLQVVDLVARTATTTTYTFKLDAIAVHPVLNMLLVGDQQSDLIRFINVNTMTETRNLAVPRHPTAIAVQTDSNFAVVLSKESDQLSIIDLNTNVVTTDWAAIDSPFATDVTVRYNQALVLSAEKDEIEAVPLPSRKPVLSSLTPDKLTAGSPATSLTLAGQYFIDTSVAYWGSTPLTTRWVSTTQLSADIPAAMIAQAGTGNVFVRTPTPGGGDSSSLVLPVEAISNNQPPYVYFYYPGPTQTYVEGQDVYFTVISGDNDGYVAKLELFRGTTLVATEYGPYLSWIWNAAPAGMHEYRVRATDNNGAFTDATVIVNVQADPTDAPYKAAWAGMLTALRAGNVDAAVSFLSDRAAVRYRPVFVTLLPQIGTIIDGWSTLERLDASEEFGEYVISTPRADGRSVFFVYFVKDSSGKIVIDSM